MHTYQFTDPSKPDCPLLASWENHFDRKGIGYTVKPVERQQGATSMSRLGKVDPKFFTAKWLLATKRSVKKWEGLCSADDLHVELERCSMCNLKNAEYGVGDCNGGCALGQAHGSKRNCVSHFDEAWNKGSKRHARALLTHLQNIQRQIEKGLAR